MTRTNDLPQQRVRKIGLLLYFFGLLLGILLAGLAVWGDLEASLFDVLHRGEQRLNSFSCPIIMTRSDKAAIRATFKNSGERDENLLVRARITDGFVTGIREEITNITLPPDGEERLTWQISPDDAAWDRIVLVRVSTVRNAPYRQLVGAACGVLLVPIDGVTGNQIVAALLVSSVVLIGAGGWLWGIGRSSLLPRERRTRQLLLAFTVLVALAVAFGFLKMWGLGLVAIISFLVLLGSTIEQFARL